MSQELRYTSAPQGLMPGSQGFCTVAASRSLSSPWREALERLSAFRPGFVNAVRYSHLRLGVAGQTRSVLSLAADAGLDYSERSNVFANHLVLNTDERPLAGPTWLLQQPGALARQWNGEVGWLSDRDVLRGDAPSRPCHSWAQVTGDAGWAGTLVEAFLNDRQATIITAPHIDLLQLFGEAISLLTADRRWDVTFATLPMALPPGARCSWQGVLAGSIEAKRASAGGNGIVVDLTTRLDSAVNSFAEAARQGDFANAAIHRPIDIVVPIATPTSEPDVGYYLPARETAESKQRVKGRPQPVNIERFTAPPLRERAVEKSYKGIVLLLLMMLACVGVGGVVMWMTQKGIPEEQSPVADNAAFSHSKEDSRKNKPDDKPVEDTSKKVPPNRVLPPTPINRRDQTEDDTTIPKAENIDAKTASESKTEKPKADPTTNNTGKIVPHQGPDPENGAKQSAENKPAKTVQRPRISGYEMVPLKDLVEEWKSDPGRLANPQLLFDLTSRSDHNWSNSQLDMQFIGPKKDDQFRWTPEGNELRLQGKCRKPDSPTNVDREFAVILVFSVKDNKLVAQANADAFNLEPPLNHLDRLALVVRSNDGDSLCIAFRKTEKLDWEPKNNEMALISKSQQNQILLNGRASLGPAEVYFQRMAPVEPDQSQSKEKSKKVAKMSQPQSLPNWETWSAQTDLSRVTPEKADHGEVLLSCDNNTNVGKLRWNVAKDVRDFQIQKIKVFMTIASEFKVPVFEIVAKSPVVKPSSASNGPKPK